MSFSFGASALPQTKPDVTAPVNTAVASDATDPMKLILAHLLASQQGTTHPHGQDSSQLAGFAQLLGALNAPQASRHLGVGGGEISADNPQGYAGGSPFSNGFFKTGAQRSAVEASRGPIPWADAPTAASSASFGTPTSSVPYVPPAPRNNPLDDPSMTQANGNPLHPAVHGFLSYLFGGRS